ncbi:MAG TPA: sialate O-acetylesterase [Candidatus Hydrogenedentes bacterium]|nr:sialate O-acetylesterase [Candidatus Hydrogenedentota bacterium]
MRARKTHGIVLFQVCLLAVSFSALGNVSVPNIIGDHMVLQEGLKIPIWGKADPGEMVTVTLDKNTEQAVADDKGSWCVRLPKMKAGGPYEMGISGKANSLCIKDILVGEVWMGSGQSNMQWTVSNSNNAAQEIANANYPSIRLFDVERTVATQPKDNCNGSWKVCSPESIPEFSAVLYYFGRELFTVLRVPMGLIHTSWGGTPAESWASRPTLASDPDLNVIVQRWDKILAEYPAAKQAYDQALGEWEKAAEKAKAEGQPEPQKPGAPQGPDHPWLAAGLYNSMIAPLVPYAVKGSIWYQGESNAGRAYQYRKLFPAMIEDWRKSWGQKSFSFYFVQLANFTDVLPEPGDSDWAELREAQTMTLKLKDTGMATIIDIGEAKDIHPRNKQDVGKRLALNALSNDYGKDVVFSGPMYTSVKFKGNEAIITFKYTDGGLQTRNGEFLKGFSIAGADKKFVWANATIQGKKVVVSSPHVNEPASVRYAWANNPVCNLYNGAGLPALPFRTDDWPGITVNKK